jgi:hypothetical protein
MSKARQELMQAALLQPLEKGKNTSHIKKLLHHMKISVFKHEDAVDDV